MYIFHTFTWFLSHNVTNNYTYNTITFKYELTTPKLGNNLCCLEGDSLIYDKKKTFLNNCGRMTLMQNYNEHNNKYIYR